jgi:hypothetical protein
MKRTLQIFPLLLTLMSFYSFGQKLNVGITFQYHVLKQVSVNADVIQGNNSYSIYYIRDNRWKFFSAGQSIVIGTVFQLDYKKLYAAIEPSFNLNTYTYTVEYPISPVKNESITFQPLFFQLDFPLYAGYQFQSSRIFRYSFFAGGVVAVPYVAESQLKSRLIDNPQEEYFEAADMRNVLYDGKPYLNTLVGVCIHFASLGKVDIRYQHRLGSPSQNYDVKFNTVGASLTYYLPLNLLRKKIYYED